MSLKLTITLVIGILFFLGVILMMIKKEWLNLKYTLLWLLTCLVLLVLAIVPQVARLISKLMGVETPANAVFVMEGLFVLLILLSLTSIVSSQMLRIRRLTQTQAILEKRVRELEHLTSENSKTNDGHISVQGDKGGN